MQYKEIIIYYSSFPSSTQHYSAASLSLKLESLFVHYSTTPLLHFSQTPCPAGENADMHLSVTGSIDGAFSL